MDIKNEAPSMAGMKSAQAMVAQSQRMQGDVKKMEQLATKLPSKQKSEAKRSTSKIDRELKILMSIGDELQGEYTAILGRDASGIMLNKKGTKMELEQVENGTKKKTDAAYRKMITLCRQLDKEAKIIKKETSVLDYPEGQLGSDILKWTVKYFEDVRFAGGVVVEAMDSWELQQDEIQNQREPKMKNFIQKAHDNLNAAEFSTLEEYLVAVKKTALKLQNAPKVAQQYKDAKAMIKIVSSMEKDNRRLKQMSRKVPEVDIDRELRSIESYLDDLGMDIADFIADYDDGQVFDGDSYMGNSKKKIKMENAPKPGSAAAKKQIKQLEKYEDDLDRIGSQYDATIKKISADIKKLEKLAKDADKAAPKISGASFGGMASSVKSDLDKMRKGLDNAQYLFAGFEQGIGDMLFDLED